jgi:arylsulfatase A-like enzyme
MLLVLLASVSLGGARHPVAQPEDELARPASSREPGREKLVFVVIDTLRADHLGVHGHARDTSPLIDRLAAEGVHMPHLVVHAPHTVPSTASILTGQLPHEHGIQFWASTLNFTGGESKGAPALPAESVTLAEAMGGAGWHTAAVVANPWLSADRGFAQGYDEYEELRCHRRQQDYVCDGAAVQRRALDLLRAHREKRLLLYLHFMDAHNPYAHAGSLPPRWRSGRGRDLYRNGPAPDVGPADLAQMRDRYDEGIRYVDGLLAGLVGFLEHSGLDQETTLVVTTDHGEEFLEHGGLGHGTHLHHELIQGFAVLWAPGRLAPQRIEERVAAIDLMPTVLATLGIAVPPQASGVDVLSAAGLGARDILTELGDRKALLRDGWKLTLDLVSGETRLISVDTAGRPRTDGAPGPAQLRASLHRALERRLAASRQPVLADLDPASEAQLRALGYLE